MQPKIMFLCFSCLIIVMLLAGGAKADIAPAIWGEVIHNNCYFDIRVNGPHVTVHQRVEMKLKKLLSDDYIYTFNTSSDFGEFDRSSLDIITPPLGVKDSTFDHGCRLEYFSEIKLEDTLKIVFAYEYDYPYPYLGEIFYHRSGGTSSWEGMVIDTNECIEITCNQDIEVKERKSHWQEWTTTAIGKHIIYHPYQWPDNFAIRICIQKNGEVDNLREHTSFEVIPEHRQYVPKLIRDEFITIEFKDSPDGRLHYSLSGTIDLDLTTAELFDPFYAWFPNEETDAFVKMHGTHEYWDWEGSSYHHRVDTLRVKPAIYEGQSGFYVLIPQLSDSLNPWRGIWTCIKATLHFQIDGIRWANSSDFILVTAPQDFSIIEFKIPRRFSFGYCSSPFESEGTHYEDEFIVKQFYGRCLTTGIAHVEWHTSTSPDHFTLCQNSPNPFNQETLIKYTLPEDGPVRLSIYNLLGERVRTLTDELHLAGEHEVRWDGRNEQGKEVASGIYLYKIESATLSDRKKMVVIR